MPSLQQCGLFVWFNPQVYHIHGHKRPFTPVLVCIVFDPGLSLCQMLFHDLWKLSSFLTKLPCVWVMDLPKLMEIQVGKFVVI